MEKFRFFAAIALTIGVTFILSTNAGPFSWMERDKFDEVMDQMNAITPKNCKHKLEGDIVISGGAVAQEPKFNKLLTDIMFANRTSLLHLHNMALNRALFLSYIHGKLNETDNFKKVPGLLYYYFSEVADVAANPSIINGSGVFFDRDLMYPNFFKSLRTNNTIPLFGPRAWRADDFNDPSNWLSEPTNSTVDITDYGAGIGNDYTLPNYKFNQWYKLWLPDESSLTDSLLKYQYSIEMKYSDKTGEFRDKDFTAFKFKGPPAPGEKDVQMPVKFTPPYYDCGRSNKWIVSAVAPVVDRLARYHKWQHIRRDRFTAVTTMDTDFLKIDINPCPISKGNSAPNLFAGIARCKQRTTLCEPLSGWGFQRGGYQCLCRPGFRLPFYQSGPFQGLYIEQATEEEYVNGFDCIPVGNRQVVPVVEGTRIIDGSRKKRSIEEEAISREELLRRERWMAEHLLNQRIEKRRAEQAASRDRFFETAKARFMRAVGLAYQDQAKTEKRKRRFVPRYSFNPSLKDQFLLQAAPSLVDKEELNRKKRLTAHYGSAFLKTEERERTKSVSSHSRKKRAVVREGAYDEVGYQHMLELFQKKDSVTATNCHTKKVDQLHLRGDAAYGKDKFFEPQARTALRLAHFLCIFLQTTVVQEDYGDLKGDTFLNKEQLFAEVLANVMADHRIFASGIFFDQNQFRNATHVTEYFAPYAWKVEKDGTRSGLHFRAKDMAGMIDGKSNYVFQEFYKDVKDRWASNTYGLLKTTMNPVVRTNKAGTGLKRFEHYPMTYRGPELDDGHWTAPYFDCKGEVKDWLMTYAVPFFGLHSITAFVEFKGVVTVTVKLDDLDVQQCPQPFYTANAFKSTARCDYESTQCVQLPGRKFKRGGYKCECKRGYEYPFNDYAWFYDGQTMEEEYKKYLKGFPNRFETLKCREASAGTMSLSWLLISSAFFLIHLVLH